MRYFFSKACLFLALLCTHAVAVDFKTYYLERSDNPDPEFSLLLHLYQTQLNASLSTSHYHRFLLHALLGIPPRPLPAMLELPSSITLPHDDWAVRERISLPDLRRAAVALALQQEYEPLPEHLDQRTLQRLLSTSMRWRGKSTTLRAHLTGLRDSTAEMEHDDHALTHLLVRAVLQVLWAEGARLQQLQVLAQRMPTARQLGVAEQRQASAVLRSLVLAVDELQELQLNNAERGLLEQLVRDQQRQRRVRQAIVGGGALTAAVLLSRGMWLLRGIDVRALWSQRVLGMHLGYSVTTLAALYPAWQLGKAVKWHVQRALQTQLTYASKAITASLISLFSLTRAICNTNNSCCIRSTAACKNSSRCLLSRKSVSRSMRSAIAIASCVRLITSTSRCLTVLAVMCA